MGFKDFAKRHKVGVTIGGAIFALVAYSKIDNLYDPIIKGDVLQEATIPQNIPKKSQQTHPYWIDLQTEKYGILRLNFDTKDIGYDNETHKERLGVFIKIDRRIGDFESKALKLEEKIQIGDQLKVKVDEHSGQERTVESLEGIYR